MTSRRNRLRPLLALLVLGLAFAATADAASVAASVASTGTTTGTSMSLHMDTAAVTAPWYSGLVTWIVGALTLLGGYMAKVIGQGVAGVFASLLERMGKRLDADKEAAIAAFVEERVRAAQEKYAAGKIREGAEKGAAKFAEVVAAVRKRFPQLEHADVDAKINAAVQKLPDVGATK